MNSQNKTKKELLKNLQDLQQKYDTISLLYETEKSTLAALVENNVDAMLVKDCNRRIIACNSAFLKATGYRSLTQLIGKTDAEILNIPENTEPVFSYKQDDLKALQLSQGEIIQREENIPYTNGELKTFITKKFPIYTNGKVIGIGVTTTDITEQKALENELKEKTSFLSTVMETSPVGIVIVNKTGEISYANSRAEQILGLVKEEITSRTYDAPLWKHTELDGSPFPDEKQPFNVVKKSLKTVFDIQHGITWPDGEVVLLSINAAPLKDNVSNFNGMIASIEDITERKQAEKQLKESKHNLIIKNEDLIKAKEKAEESYQLKSAFLQNLSHEIRTPLNAIHGFSGFLNKPNLSDEKRKSFISIIQNSGNQLLSIISHVLTISALETNQEKVNIDKVRVNNIIVDLLAIFKQQSVNQNISLYAKQPLNDKQSEIYTDKTKITQILSNLISNAMKFTHEGFIEFGYNLKNSELEFYVKDSGIGIKPELQEKIFERFRQADLSINKKYGGTGLGLSISKGFAELLGGKIWVNSELDKGSTFFFTIPYKPINEVENNQEIQKHIDNKPIILIAEDEEFNFLYIEEILNEFDYHLIHAKDGQETVDIFKSNPDISLILMDIKMPIMDGHTAAKIIKEQKPNMQIIAQSAYALEHEIEKYSGIFDDYLTKPISENDLRKIVAQYIDNE